MIGKVQQRHLVVGAKLLVSIALVELVIMLAFSAFHAEARLGPLAMSILDTVLLSSSASLMIFFWVVQPMKTMEEYVRVEDALVERARATVLRAEIGTALVQSNELQSVLQLCAEAIVRHLDAAFARIWSLDAKGEFLELQASAGLNTHLNGPHSRIQVGISEIGLIAEQRKPHVCNVVIGDPQIPDQDWARRNGLVAFAGHPLIVYDKLVGVMAVFSRKPLTDATLVELASVADEIALGIERRNAAAQIHYLAYYDALTGLPNRNFFKESLGRTIEDAKRYKRPFGLVFVNLDDFKKVNDTLGHGSGDELLKAVTSRLLDSLRSSDLASRMEEQAVREIDEVCRIGGDEFIILLQELPDVQDAARIARRIQAAIAQPFILGGQEVFITASSGITIYPGDGDDAETLMKNADTALHFAKSRGKNESHYYSRSMNAASLEILSMDNDLHRALDRGEIIVHYQPKVDIVSRRLSGAEALVRWMHPRKGLIFPSTFIPLAEATGLIVPIGMHVLRSVCLQNKQWQEQGYGPLRVAVNLSGRQFDQKNLAQDITGVLAEIGLRGEFLEIEITESTIMKNPDGAIKTLTDLKSAQILIAVDDFGTGYSSLNYLRRLPLDALKIDVSFIKNVLTNASDAAIVKAIIGMAHALGLKTLAEGVEGEEQAVFLRDQGCDQMQSYYSGRPVPAEEFAKSYLENHPR